MRVKKGIALSKWKKVVVLGCFMLGITMPAKARAQEPYRGYHYNSYDSSVPAPNVYRPGKCVTGGFLGIGDWKEPQDLFVEKESRIIYVLDSGNKRIVMLDERLEYIGQIDAFYNGAEEMEVGVMTGIYVAPSAGIYLADPEYARVLCVDFEGRLLRTYEKPESALYTQTTFRPQKVIVDSALNVYIISTGAYQGAVVYNRFGDFTGYYGSTSVTPTLKIIVESLWKRIMTREQTDAMERYVPVEYVNFDIDSDDFVYTVTQTNGAVSDKAVRKINPAGINILDTNGVPFGDHDVYVEENRAVVTQFNDIHVNEDGFIYALDVTGKKVFVYDAEGNLVTVFGRMGSQAGTFKQVTAVDGIGSKVLVLDQRKKDLTSFELTEFGSYVYEAITLYNRGLYEQARQPWQEVVKRDGNYEMAYVGLGKAAMNLYQYEDAMRYFKLGNSRKDYSNAYKQFRVDFVRSHFTVIVTAIGFLAASVLLIGRRKRKKFYFLPYVILHPVKGYEELKYHKAGSMRVSVVILFLWFAAVIIERQATGFIHNTNNPETLNVFFLLVRTVILFVLWCVANWAFCTLMDGKGTFRNIWINCSYALVPMVGAVLTATVISNILTEEEVIFRGLILIVGYAWTALLLACALSSVHDYTAGMTFWSILLTVFGIACIVFVLVLSWNLYKQVAELGWSIWNELQLRM